MRFFFFVIFILFSATAFTQQVADSSRYFVTVKFENYSDDFKIKKVFIPNKPIIKPRLDVEFQKVLQQVYSQGFIEAHLKQVDTTSSTVSYSIDVGPQYEWKRLEPGNVDEGVLSRIGYRDKLYFDTPLSYGEVRRLFRNIVKHYENNGYPFASIKLDSVKIESGEVSAKLLLEKGKKIQIDTIKVIGTSELSTKYLYNYIGIQQGDDYNEEKIAELTTRLKELPFVTEVRPALVEFFADRTSLTLYVNHKKANSFDGIIGFLPDDNNEGELLITGDIKIELNNAMNRGEEIELNWRRLQTQTQELFGRMRYPFLFNTPFGAEGQIRIYRRDTTFTTVTTNLSLQYIFRGGDYIEIYWENDQSSLISTYDLDIITTLPEYADVRNNSFGIGAKFTELNYRLNPRRGFDFEAKSGIGQREIRQNPGVNPEVYDSLEQKTSSIKARGQGRVFFPLGVRHTTMFGVKAGTINNQELFTNELYRIGGLKTLRGFDEESIFASSYSIFTLEYRFLIEQNSFFQVFYDQGWYENRVGTNLITDTPFGFGAGISFDTKVGIFSLSYALGSQFNNPIQFRASKIHFGFVNYF